MAKPKKDPELELITQFNYKRQADKQMLKLYLHNAMTVGLLLIVIALVAFYPVPRVIYLALAVFGAFVTITGWFLQSRLNKVK